MTPKPQNQPGSTPRPSTGIFGSTPSRDNMGINTPRSFDASEPQQYQKHKLSSLFNQLPKPKNDFDIVLPDESDQDHKDTSTTYSFIEDASDVLKRKQKEKQVQEMKDFMRQSSVLRKELPLPIISSFIPPISDTNVTDDIDRMIKEEMRVLVLHDATHNPTITPRINTTSDTVIPTVQKEELDESYIQKALDLVRKELENIQMNEDIAEMSNIVGDSFIFVPSNNNTTNTSNTDDTEQGEYKHISELSESEHADALLYQFNKNKERMKEQAIKASRIEKRIASKLDPLIHSAQAKLSDLQHVHEELVDATIKKRVYENVKEREDWAIDERIEKLRSELRMLSRRESELQSQYRELMQKNRG
jgi:pre-mRNA-splicing factor CDC5/CEF1